MTQKEAERHRSRAAQRPLRRWFDLGDRREVRVTIHSTGTVEFRRKHERVVYEASLRTLYAHAAKLFAAREVENRKIAREARRAERKSR